MTRMFKTDQIVISARQGDLIDHCLKNPDSIADALEDRHPREVVLTSVSRLLHFTKKHVIPTASFGEVDADILAHCIERSTWVTEAFIAATQERNPRIRIIATRTIETLAEKFREAGIHIESVPLE